MYTSSGVPITNVIRKNVWTPEYRLEHDFNWSTRRTFYYGLIKYSLLIGAVGAWYFTDSDFLNDDLNSRPDFHPMRQLCDHSMPSEERKVFVDLLHAKYFGFNRGSGNYFGKQLPNTTEHSFVRKVLKYFYPYYEYDVDGYNYSTNFDLTKDYLPTDLSNHYHFDP